MQKTVRAHEGEPEKDGRSPVSSHATKLHLVPSGDAERNAEAPLNAENSIREAEARLKNLAKNSALRVEAYKRDKRQRDYRDEIHLAKQERAMREATGARGDGKKKKFKSETIHIADLIAEHQSEMTDTERKRQYQERAKHPIIEATSLAAERVSSGTIEERLRFAESVAMRLAELRMASAKLEKPYDAAWPIILELRNYELQLAEILDDARMDEEMLTNEERTGSLAALTRAQHDVHRLLSELEQVTRLRQTALSKAEQGEAREETLQRYADDLTHLMAVRAELPVFIKDEQRRNRAVANLRGRAERLRDEIAVIERLPAAEQDAPEHAAVREMAKYLLADTQALLDTLEGPEELTDADFAEETEELIDLTDVAEEDKTPSDKPARIAAPATFTPLPRRLTPEQHAARSQALAIQERVASGTTEDILAAAMDMLPESITSQIHAPSETHPPKIEELTEEDIIEEDVSGVRSSPQAAEGTAEETALKREWAERRSAKRKQFAERDTVPVSLTETTAKATRAQRLIQDIRRDLRTPMTYETRERYDNALLTLSKLYALLKERQTLLMEQPESSDERERADTRKEKDYIAATLFDIEDVRHAVHLASNSALTEQRTIPERKQAVRNFEEVKKTRILHVIEKIKQALAQAGEPDPEAALRRDARLGGKKQKYEIPNATRWALQNELHTVEREFLNRLYGAPGLEQLAARKHAEAPLLRLNANASLFDLWRAANAELERTSSELGKKETPRKDPWLTRAMDRIQDGATRLVMGKPHAKAQRDHWLTRTMDAMFDRRPRKKKTPKRGLSDATPKTPPEASREVYHVGHPKRTNLQPPTVAEIQTHLIAQAEAAGLSDAQRIYASLLKQTSGKEIAHEVPRYMSTMTQLRQALASGKPELIRHSVQGFEKLHERFATEQAPSLEGAALLARAKRTLNDAIAPAYLREDAPHEQINLKTALITQAESAGIHDAGGLYDRLTRDTAATKHTELTPEVPTYLAAMTRLALALRKREEIQELERALTAFNATNKRFKAAGFPILESEDLLKRAKKAVAEPINITPSQAA